MRIDASVSFGPDHTPRQLHRILVRNRFEGAIAHGEPLEEAPEWILGWIGKPGAADHPKLVAIESTWPEMEPRPNLVLEFTSKLADLKEIAAFARAHPESKIVVTRSGGAPYGAGPNGIWQCGMEALAVQPNVCIKMDGILANAPPSDPKGWGPSAVTWQVEDYRPWIQTTLQLFGPERCLYGSGWPNETKSGTWKEALACFTQAMGAQTLEFRERILGGTAAEVYGIP